MPVELSAWKSQNYQVHGVRRLSLSPVSMVFVPWRIRASCTLLWYLHWHVSPNLPIWSSKSYPNPILCRNKEADFTSHVEQDDGWFPDSANTLVTGIDAGVLVASAFCSSRNLTQLLTSSVEAVRVAFHTALVAIELSNTVDPLSTSSAWTISVSGLSLDKATTILRDFSAAQVSKSYNVMREGTNSVTLY